VNRNLSLPPKHRRRLGAVVLHSLQSLVLPIFNVLISLLVIRLASVTLWGEFVQLLIVVQLGAHIAGWGNKEYLLRAFSRRPQALAEQWQTAFFTRCWLLPTFAAVMALWGWPFGWLIGVWLWGIGLFVAQSLEVLVVYQRAFLFALLVELGVTAVIVGGLLWLGGDVSVGWLIALFAGGQLGKAAVYLLYWGRMLLGGRFGRVAPAYFALAFPFFLLGLTGMVQSRVDLYSVSYFMSPAEVGQYQVLTGLLLYIQSLANFILLPFVKLIYRLEAAVIHKISLRLFLVGLLLVPPAVLLTGWLLRHVYQFDVSPLLLLVGGLHVLPIFYTLPIIYALYKADLQRQVLLVNAVNVALNLVLNIVWIPRWGLLGALLSTALTSWLTFLFYASRRRPLLPKRSGATHF
jgi:O-antigen/teichoic acid export membrane protein